MIKQIGPNTWVNIKTGMVYQWVARGKGTWVRFKPQPPKVSAVKQV